MERLTTDSPQGNFATILNYVFSKDGWAHIRSDGKSEDPVQLTQWARKKCIEFGCVEMPEDPREVDEEIMDCLFSYPDCPVALPYVFACQAVHLRDRLKAIEDILGDEYDLDHLRELAQAEKDGRLVVLPCKVGDMVYVTYGEGYRPHVVDRIHILANCKVQVRMRHFCTETLWISASEFGKTVFFDPPGGRGGAGADEGMA